MRPGPDLSASWSSIRRLVVTRQRLAGARPTRPGRAAMLSVVRDLGFVQWDPVPIVAPSHLLAFWSRLGPIRRRDLEALLWTQKRLFLHWTPIASLVLTEDFPIYHSLMRRYPGSMSRSWGQQGARARAFLAKHRRLAARLLAELERGPRTTAEFPDHARTSRRDGEWSPSSDVAQMLYHLTMRGDVMVVGHRGNQNLWGLSEQFLPTGTDRTVLAPAELERMTAVRALRALGVATPREILLYFVKGRYADLPGTLKRLEAAGEIHRVRVDGPDAADAGYVHTADVEGLRSVATDDWTPRVSLLPPFDTMLGSTGRTDRIFGFHYVREQFLPAAKRRYGTYVLPILYGEEFIGRIDPRLDRTHATLEVRSVHAEPGAPRSHQVAEEIRSRIADLAEFVGARTVVYRGHVPSGWGKVLN